ncbi:hypothetical protein ACIBL3_39200 [Kribbella sp. NPDC050124]|uniref:hypothetical protein n=1 Tax=Kribbella sp. NPDC050124 TaxID=3364114 RepID=UPI0037BCED84
MRDAGFGGLAALVNRQVWRDSEAGPPIVERVLEGMRDPNPVVRMRAATAVLASYSRQTAGDRAAAVGELLLAEENLAVKTVLVGALIADTPGAPQTVDTVLEQLLEGADDLPEARSEATRGVTEMLTYLALVARTPFAVRVVERWCRDAASRSAAVALFAQSCRDYLRHDSRDVQEAAFRLLGTAVEVSLSRWMRDPSAHRAGAELSEAQLDEFKGAATVSHEIAQQIYFASGAFDQKQARQVRADSDLDVFAELAFPVLQACARFNIPQSIHKAVETMIFLAPLDEPRALLAIAEAVPIGGTYAGDSLVGDEVMPYLHRLLAEHRPLVLHDDKGIAAFRHLLAAFAGAGNEQALALAYTFADVFR